MIPTIEQIVEDLLAGNITQADAVNWLNQHAEDAHADLRDHFAGLAMQGLIASNDEGAGDRIDEVPEYAYFIADAMMKAREA